MDFAAGGNWYLVKETYALRFLTALSALQNLHRLHSGFLGSLGLSYVLAAVLEFPKFFAGAILSETARTSVIH